VQAIPKSLNQTNMHKQGLREELLALKKTATKGEKKIIDKILERLDGNSEAAPLEALETLGKKKTNSPFVHAVVDIVVRFVSRVAGDAFKKFLDKFDP
jgi:hypothetical protein